MEKEVGAGSNAPIGEDVRAARTQHDMATTHDRPSALSYDIAAWLLTGGALLLALPLRVLPALLAGLLVYGVGKG